MLPTLLRNLWVRRELVVELVRRELRDRHAGQTLGAVWAYGHPLLLMLLYTALFAFVFPTRFSGSGAAQDFSVNVIAGIVPWLAFQDLLGRAPSILLGHANLVKQIVFPTEVLPVKTAIASLLSYSVGAAFALCYATWHGTLSWLALALPLVIGCQLMAMAGVAFLLSAAGVFLRDLRELIAVFCSINLFAQPILYNPYTTPSWLQVMFTANPFSHLIWCWQDALFTGRIEHPVAWMVTPMLSVGVLVGGWAFYRHVRHSFGEAL